MRICVKTRCHINCIRKALRSPRGKCNAFLCLTPIWTKPHAALCVLGPRSRSASVSSPAVSMPHAALCVLGLCRPQPLSHAGCEGVLESHPFFALFLPSKCVFRTEDRMADRIYSLSGADCAVLERRSGGTRSVRPCGSFSILLRTK